MRGRRTTGGRPKVARGAQRGKIRIRTRKNVKIEEELLIFWHLYFELFSLIFVSFEHAALAISLFQNIWTQGGDRGRHPFYWMWGDICVTQVVSDVCCTNKRYKMKNEDRITR